MNVAIIAAAGQGVRMGSKRAKQFLELDGIPVIIHTLQRFQDCADIHEVVVVLPEKDVKRFRALARKHGLTKVASCIAGGKTRGQSVKLGFDSISPHVSIVAVHDGVRPFVTPAEISKTIKTARRARAAILVAAVTDTIKVLDKGSVSFTPLRAQLRRALTPQCFHYQTLREAFKDPAWRRNSERFTDEAMLVEQSVKVAVVEGNARNIKITTPEDLVMAEVILKRDREFRINRAK
ncbi:MAG: 2-C-methyl-D-erythritol 4-phosphate cytidylyltransferase [Blastocatellia bacterium]|jgi:2-C-methyl-D-erythritol 4-phosphate cytidylyltransferase|nr:2-C-methyl-D-erythritol 4-phosphate cytidylyltransferase [Blastocatellia bacterium]